MNTLVCMGIHKLMQKQTYEDTCSSLKNHVSQKKDSNKGRQKKEEEQGKDIYI